MWLKLTNPEGAICHIRADAVIEVVENVIGDHRAQSELLLSTGAMRFVLESPEQVVKMVTEATG